MPFLISRQVHSFAKLSLIPVCAITNTLNETYILLKSSELHLDNNFCFSYYFYNILFQLSQSFIFSFTQKNKICCVACIVHISPKFWPLKGVIHFCSVIR